MHRHDITGLILCGGRSTRFGSPKAHFLFEGMTLVERAAQLLTQHVARVYLGVGESREGRWPAAELIPDITPGLGPIGGIQAAMAELRTEWLFVLPVDLPFMTHEAIQILTASAHSDDLAVIARDEDDQVHPLCGLYRREAGASVERNLKAGALSMRAVLRALQNVRYVTLPTETLRNVNRPEDLS